MNTLLLGSWLFVALFYRGEVLPLPNEDLRQYYNFNSQSENELFYFRVGERGACRRKAHYEIKESVIEQTVTEVDSDNADFCSQDPDMQMGAFSIVPFELKNNQLWMTVPLGEEDIVFIFEKEAGP